MIKKRLFVVVVAITSLLMVSGVSAKGNWKLDERNSHVSFFTIKKGGIGESHSFFDISGKISKNNASVSIQTDSVDSEVDIRDERIKKFIFDSDNKPTIDISSDVKNVFDRLEKRSIITAEMPAKLTLNGVTTIVTLNVSVAKKAKNELIVTSIQPVIIKAEDYRLSEGVRKLSEIAGSITIATAVPVNFVLHFKS